VLEALISLRRDENDKIRGAETDEKKEGDFIVVKKKPCEWGSKEIDRFRIIDHQNDALEASMTKDVMVLPYAVYDKEGNMVNRSKYRAPMGQTGADIKHCLFDDSPR